MGNQIRGRDKETKKKLSPLTIKLLRPLRERFNIAVDLFKYNKKTDFERFVSKEELTKSIKDLKKEAINIENLKKVKNITTEETEYLRQIKSDINCARELIEIHA